MAEKELKKQLIADQLSKIIKTYTNPASLLELVGDGIKNGDRMRVIVEVSMFDGFPTFKGVEFRVRRDDK